MSLSAQSASLGIAFAATAVVLTLLSLQVILRRKRSAYTALFGLLAVFLLIGPVAFIQLAQIQWHFGIVDSHQRDIGFRIYGLVLVLLGAFAFWQVNGYNKRNRERTPTI